MHVDSLHEYVDAARGALHGILADRSPRIGMVLGSGLSAEALPLESRLEIPASEIPHLPTPRVVGHRTAWTFGTLEGTEIIVAGGRVHRYEGWPLWHATLGVRVMAAIGCQGLVVTNAAGGIRRDLSPGSLMRIRDHLNLFGDSPLIGIPEREGGDRFQDLSAAYDPAWGQRILESAKAAGIAVGEGVYAGWSGPQYETPAEIGMLEALGADAVGMSTVPEVIVARHCGLRVFGLSLISNAAAGRSEDELSHEEVIEAGRAAQEPLRQLLAVAVRTF